MCERGGVGVCVSVEVWGCVSMEVWVCVSVEVCVCACMCERGVVVFGFLLIGFSCLCQFPQPIILFPLF